MEGTLRTVIQGLQWPLQKSAGEYNFLLTRNCQQKYARRWKRALEVI